MFGPEKYKTSISWKVPQHQDLLEQHIFLNISQLLNSLEYQFRGRDICPFLEKSTWNQPIPQSLNDSFIKR